MPTEPIKIWIPDERPLGWQKIYKMGHWITRQQEADRCHQLVAVYAREYTPFRELVDIQVTAFFDANPMDSDNINDKFYIDGLKGLVIVDDDIKHVRNTSTRSIVHKPEPGLLIEVTPAKIEPIPGVFKLACSVCDAEFGSLANLFTHHNKEHQQKNR